MFDLGRLRALHAVATYGTVLAAADALHLTPSGVSQHLGKLEREVGAPLVEKDGRRLRLTELGRVLAGHAGRVLAAVEEAEAAVAEQRGTVCGQIRVAAIATACRGLLPHALGALAVEYPDLNVGLHEGDPHIALDLIRRGVADVAVIDDWPEAKLDLPAHLSAVELGLDHVDLFVPTAGPLAGRTTVTLEEVRHQRWISATPGAICHTWLTRILPGVEPDFLVDEFASQLELIAGGFGVALIPRLARTEPPPGVTIIAVTPLPTRRVMAVWRTASAARPAVRAVVAALEASWGQRTS